MVNDALARLDLRSKNPEQRSKAQRVNKEGKEMNTREDILMKYEKADTNKRLLLFLQFRDLRDDFLEIELKEYRPLTFSNPKLSPSVLGTIQIWRATC